MAERSDVEHLERLLAIEERLVAAYEAALRRDAIDPGLGELLLGHEREHAAALRRALAGSERNPRASVPSAELTAALRSPSEFARYAARLERTAVDAYVAAAAAMRDERLRQPLGSILACEAAHGVALRHSLGERLIVD
jgi:Ferritin-like domain